jgi:signal transduction histidine kinase
MVVVATALLLLGLVTLLNNRQYITNQVFATLCGLSAGYVLVNYLADHDQVRALLWGRGTFTLAAFTLCTIVIFANNFPTKILRSGYEQLFVVTTFVVAATTQLPGFIPSVVLKDQKTDIVPGPLYSIFLVYLLVYLVAAVILVEASRRRGNPLQRQRLRYVSAGFLLTAAALSVTNLLLPLVLGNNDLSGYGTYFLLIFIGFSSFAIVKHRLFNIRLIVARSIAYVLIIATLAALYIGVGFALSQTLFTSEISAATQTSVNAALAVLLALGFQPLRNFFGRITDNIFFKDAYDSQSVINAIGHIVVAEVKLDRLLHRSLTTVCRELKIASGQFYIFDEGDIYKIQHYGAVPHKIITAPHLQQLRRRMAVADELPDGRERRQMEEYGYRVVLHLRTKEGFVGYLLLGDKLSGDIYTAQDLEVLEILGQELAVAISNAKAYEEIANFNTTLQHKVEVATKRLREANIHLKELDEAKDEFISMASHQLRTPLTTIKGYLSMLQEGDAGKLTPQQIEFINYAYGGSQRMVNLISDLLNVSRMSAGKFLIQRAPADLARIAAEEVDQLQHHAQAKGLTLTFTPPKGSLPLIELDEDKIRQVIMNFIDNAIYYTKQGTVRVEMAADSKKVQLTVTDSGIGVPKAEQSHLFSKFYRAGNAQNVRPDGTGLGLFLAKRVVEDHGGTILFSSREGVGSTFGFSLLLTINQVTTHAPHKRPPRQPARPVAASRQR